MSNRPRPSWLPDKSWLPWLIGVGIVLFTTIIVVGQLTVNTVDQKARYSQEHANSIRSDIAQLSRAEEDQKRIEDLKARVVELEGSLRDSNKILESTGSKTLPDFLKVLPACVEEDGSTHAACVWDGRKQGNGIGAVVVNFDHGRLSFYPQTNGWTVN